MQPELIADTTCQIGENPLWHPMEHRLYWTDISQGMLYRYDPATGHHELCHRGEAAIGGFTIQADGALLLFMSRGAVATWREGQLTSIVDEIPAERESRFNDVIADPAGRVFCGTMATPQGLGRLYRLDLDGSVHVILENIGTSNGMGFTLDRRSMYYTDSAQGEIYRFDYDLETGALSNQRVLIRISEENGRPDGLTVDAEGHIWSARWNGSALYRFTPDGLQEQRIDFPARKVSSVTFGGDDLSDLYVTTALDNGTRAREGEGAGALFRLRPAVKGVAEFFSRIKL